MNPTDVIVTYASIEKALGGDLASSVEGADGTEAAAFLQDVGKALQAMKDDSRHSDVMIAPNDRVASLLLAMLAEDASENSDDLANAGKLIEHQDGVEVKYDHHDVRWVGSLFSWLKKLGGKYPWADAPVEPTPIGSDCRVAVLGDWGSGRYGAPVCAKSIDATTPAYDVGLHLGDVYYAGTNREVENNFLALWPTSPSLSRACNSNHEMYTGGEAYFKKTVAGFGHPNGSSNFTLANDDWLLVGLDTGYVDGDIQSDKDRGMSDRQTTWLKKVLQARDGRAVILLSHHQPFSAFDDAGEKLREAVKPILESGVLHGWYWGHEHRCILYERHPLYGHGRCIGHSGFPADRDKLDQHAVDAANPDGSKWYRVPEGDYPAGVVLDGPNAHIPKHADDYSPHGYLSLEFQGKKLREMVHAADGTTLRTTEFDLGR